MTNQRLLGGLLLLLGVGCASAKPATNDDAPPTESTEAKASAEPSNESGTSEAASGTSGTAPASTATPATEQKEAEAPKDESALVLELTIKGKELDDASKSAMEKEAREIIKKSSKLALTDKGIKAPRLVIATLTAEPLASDKKGFTVKLGMTGVTKNGNCPLFDLNQKLSMEGGKKDNAADVGQLRSAALTALLVELEQKSPTLKPNANCTPYK